MPKLIEQSQQAGLAELRVLSQTLSKMHSQQVEWPPFVAQKARKTMLIGTSQINISLSQSYKRYGKPLEVVLLLIVFK